MLDRLKHATRHLSLLAALSAAGVMAMPVAQFGLGGLPASALADDDDGDDDGDDDDDRGSDRGGRADTWRSSRSGDLRSLFRWPWREQRRPPVRRVAAVPDRAPGQLVAIGLDPSALADLVQQGFAIESRTPVAALGGDMVRLAVPRGMTLAAARAVVAERSATATVEFNHYYRPQVADEEGCAGDRCALVRTMIGWPTGADGGTSCAGPQRIGLIDTAINVTHPALAAAKIEVIPLESDRGTPSGAQHGTAVAALLVGASRSRAPGLLPEGQVVAIDAFRRMGAASDAAAVYDLVRGLDILIGRNLKVINLSLTGPANGLLERVTQAALDRGTILIAAAGNEGPNAKPVYPAAYPDVIAVTAVDRSGRPYRRAVRGEHIDIAAPGVGVWTAASVSGARQKTGTSFAAPFVTAAVSALLTANPALTRPELEAILYRAAADIGTLGKDTTFGHGLLNVRDICGVAGDEV